MTFQTHSKEADIVNAFSPLYTTNQIQNVLKNKSLTTLNKYQLWSHNESENLYTLKTD